MANNIMIHSPNILHLSRPEQTTPALTYADILKIPAAQPGDYGPNPANCTQNSYQCTDEERENAKSWANSAMECYREWREGDHTADRDTKLEKKLIHLFDVDPIHTFGQSVNASDPLSEMNKAKLYKEIVDKMLALRSAFQQAKKGEENFINSATIGLPSTDGTPAKSNANICEVVEQGSITNLNAALAAFILREPRSSTGSGGSGLRSAPPRHRSGNHEQQKP